MIGLTCEICGERFDVADQEGPQRDSGAADWEWLTRAAGESWLTTAR